MHARSRGQKWLTVIVMLIAAVATVYGTLTYSPELQELGRSYGPAGHVPRIYLWGAEIAVCLAVWALTYLVCAAIQRSFDVWQGFNFLPVLLLAVIGLNFGPQYFGYKGLQRSGPAAIRALTDDNVTQIILNNNACEADLDRVGFPKFMRVFALGAQNGLPKARAAIKQARAVADGCQQRDAAQAAKFRQAVEALNITARDRQAVLAELDGNKDGAEADRRRLRQIETELLDEFQREVDDLAASKAGWYAASFDMVFYDKHDLKRFKAHVAKAKELLAERQTVSNRLWSRDITRSAGGGADH